MTDQEAAKIIKEILADFGNSGWLKEAETAFNMAISALESAPVWTPCSEGQKLPKDFEQCLISYRICDQWRVEEAWMRNRKWCTRYGIITSLDRIDAWMPKPEPYNPNKAQEARADATTDT